MGQPCAGLRNFCQKPIKHLGPAVRHLDGQHEGVRADLDGESEEWATRGFSLGEAHDVTEVDVGCQGEFEPDGGDALGLHHSRIPEILPFTELGRGSPRVKRARNRDSHVSDSMRASPPHDRSTG